MSGVLAVLLVAGGSALGAPARYLVEEMVRRRGATVLPWGTWLVNVTGSFAAGLLAGAAIRTSVPEHLVLAAGTGFLGSYTTFSTFAWQAVALVESRAVARAVLTVAGSVVVGLAAAALGLALAGR